MPRHLSGARMETGAAILGLAFIGVLAAGFVFHHGWTLYYGDAEAQTIVENCGSTLILRCSASERGGTAEFASRLIGQREIIRRSVSHTRSTSDRSPIIGHGSRTTSEQHLVEYAVLPSEIEQLPDRAGFLKFASQPVWMMVRFPVQDTPKGVPQSAPA